MTSPAATRRLSAVNALCTATVGSYFDEDGQPVVEWNVTHAERAELAADIRQLAPLGRTDRWQSSVERWAREVENSDEKSFQWAFNQFGVWACYAAE